MKKLFLLLAMVGMIFTACQSGGDVEEENGGTPLTPKMELSQQSINVKSESDSYSIDVTSTHSWTATSDNDWIIIRTQTGKAGIEELAFHIMSNEEEHIRDGIIVIKNEDYDLIAELYITQKAFVPAITINNEMLTFKAAGGTQEVEISTNFEYEVSEKSDWLSVKKNDKGINVIALESEIVEERTAEITISSGKYNISRTIKVTQKAFEPVISINHETLMFTAEGGSQNVDITTNIEYEVSVNAEWLSYTKNSDSITITASNYAEVEERTAEITISSRKYNISKTIKVTQKAFEPVISINHETLMFTVEGGSQKFEITANIDYEVSTNAEWLSYTQNKNSITVTVPNYAEVDERTAEITILNEKYNISKTIKVTQSAFVPEISAAKSELTFEAVGGKQSVTITANVDWEVSSNESWVTCEKTDDGVVITLPIYIGANNRDANITLSNEKYNISTVVKVTQYKLSESERNKLILYTSSDAKIVEPYRANGFGATIVSNTYENGKGVIMFDAPVTSIGEDAFYGCKSLTSATIPNSVTSIGEDAFYYCSSLKSVTIGNGVTSIGSSAFSGCSSLTSITIPDSVTSIGNYAFSSCTSLTSVTIPDSVTSIGDCAFYGCSSLTSVTIPDSVTSIGGSAFYSCTSLTSVTIPDSITSIGGSAFYSCKGELIINSKIVETNYTNTNYPSDDGWLYGAKFTKLTIGDSVTSIGYFAFSGCTKLTSVTIPDSVTSIGDYAFSSCTSLTSVTIPDSVTSIGSWAFGWCASLTSVTIPNSVTSIGRHTFAFCTSLRAFYGKFASSDNRCLIVNGVLDSFAPAGLTEYTIPDSVTKIGDEAFDSCIFLESVTIPDSVTSIGDNAFYGCKSLTSVTIGNSVTSIRYYAFAFCTSLEEVYCKSTTPPRGDSNMFYNNDSRRNIYVPRNSVSAYKSAQYWRDYADYIKGYDF